MVSEKKEKIKKTWAHTSFFISDAFRDIWERFTELAEVDSNPAFAKYCNEIENENLDKKGHKKRGIYIRWVLTDHFFKNMHKLSPRT